MQMTVEEVDEFLRQPRMANLVTLREDGCPTVAPLWFEWADGVARLFSGRSTGKVRRLLRDNRAALTVTAGVGEPPAWVTIEGTASIVTGGVDLARRLAPRYNGEEFAAKAISRLKGDADGLCLITITPNRILHW
ncbi:pyridoxamine 5'-phosphate oxidase family protein [Streptomyces sp. NPDC056910]|jgi:PPOX class probable F420-dependent enzyme|uniref:Pyridoxamine 5'-phosphate oxidase family protein n=1 Tax=Streptomyces aureus TaxID=193461 RepID=A0ABV4T040_9ACTN